MLQPSTIIHSPVLCSTVQSNKEMFSTVQNDFSMRRCFTIQDITRHKEPVTRNRGQAKRQGKEAPYQNQGTYLYTTGPSRDAWTSVI